ncbi:hypothetical protein K432DRAFT_472744 [Lepidopterella palustris CBS 459.81]|uniref:Uncharacterized protein n=1 Tax=Lepidopterella palustris CBS 459.81 TaxID=1314670 RepID=A0A8E2DXT8_9PEZI|nr:hypothetical protein K432DRAFT_472744 [Lepidopterella palustris CBS 459.81]
MFRWYQNAKKCYIYLSEVLMAKTKASDYWESAFQGSKCFTHGWTLQELLAPSVVEFFPREGKRLGNKRVLERQIHDITGIANSALRGAPLVQFGVDERFS